MHKHLTHSALALLIVFGSIGTGWTLPQSDRVGLRQIVVTSEQDAVEIRQIITDGTPFDAVAAVSSQDAASAARGGYLGQMSLTDLRPEFRDAVAGLGPGEISVTVQVADTYFLFQVVSEIEAQWTDLDEAGARALGQARNEQAIAYFEDALLLAETFAPDSPQLLRSLDSLATVYRIEDRYVNAEALYRRALDLVEALGASDLERAQLLNGLAETLQGQARYEPAEQLFFEVRSIREEALGPDHPEVAAVGNNLAELYAEDGRPHEAAALFEESLALLENSLGATHPATLALAESHAAFGRSLVPELLEGFSTIVSFSDFPDDEFDTISDSVLELLPLVPLTELAYVQVKDILLEVGLTDQTEDILQIGLEKFPDSRILRIYMADLMASTGRTEDSLGLLDEAARLPRPEGLDVPTDIRQQGVISERLGDFLTALFEYDQALEAYARAVELDPTTPGGRLKLARAYFNNDQIDEALAQFTQAIQDAPEESAGYLGLAETYLALGRWDETATAAERAIELGTTDSRALYLSGTALARTGEQEKGRERLQEFSEVDALLSEGEHDDREVQAISVSATNAYQDTGPETALEILIDGVRMYPASGRLRMNLGILQSRLDLHEAAVETFESMIADGVGRQFMVHKNLAAEYETLGDDAASGRHQQIYLDTREAELIVYAPE